MACKKCNDCKDNGCTPTVYPKCILLDVAYPCLGTKVGDTGKDLFAAIESAICTLSGANATCRTWSNITNYSSDTISWGPVGGATGAQFSNTVGCLAGLRGLVTGIQSTRTGNYVNSIVCTITNLPAKTKIIPTTAKLMYTSGFYKYAAGVLTISVGGVITLDVYHGDTDIAPTDWPVTIQTSLDGIWYETA